MLVASGLLNTLHNRKMNAPGKTPLLESTLTCPDCGHRQTETMPTEACQFFWNCPQCQIPTIFKSPYFPNLPISAG